MTQREAKRVLFSGCIAALVVCLLIYKLAL